MSFSCLKLSKVALTQVKTASKFVYENDTLFVLTLKNNAVKRISNESKNIFT